MIAWLFLLQLVAAAGLRQLADRPTGMDKAPREASHRKCRVSDQDSCSLSSLARNEITLVYPDPVKAHTRCLFSMNKDYAFQVVPRSADQLLVFFEGGGACWNRFTTLSLDACWRDQIRAFPLNHTIFDDSSPDNPYRDFTVVWVNACSGDLHCGNVTRSYSDDNHLPVQQRGFYNTKSVLDWLKANLGVKKLRSLALMGESAGAIGVQVWAQRLLTELKYEKASVLADSYAAVFPKGFQGPVFKSMGACETGLFEGRPYVLGLCHAQKLTIPAVFDATIQTFPSITFAMLNSKYDSNQILYDKVASITTHQLPHSPEDYNREMLNIMRRYNRHPNFVSYLASSTKHVFSNGFLGFKRIQNATSVDREYTRRLPPTMRRDRKQALLENYLQTSNDVLDWISKLPLGPGESIASHCELLDSRHLAALDHYPTRIDYCDPILSSKVFTAPLRE